MDSSSGLFRYAAVAPADGDGSGFIGLGDGLSSRLRDGQLEWCMEHSAYWATPPGSFEHHTLRLYFNDQDHAEQCKNYLKDTGFTAVDASGHLLACQPLQMGFITSLSLPNPPQQQHQQQHAAQLAAQQPLCCHTQPSRQQHAVPLPPPLQQQQPVGAAAPRWQQGTYVELAHQQQQEHVALPPWLVQQYEMVTQHQWQQQQQGRRKVVAVRSRQQPETTQQQPPMSTAPHEEQQQPHQPAQQQQQPQLTGTADGPAARPSKQPRGRAADPSVAPDALHLVLQHLSSPDGDQQLYQVAAHVLHRTCKQLRASCRATCSQLCLHLYYRGMVSMYPDPTNSPSILPWPMLAACPMVTSWAVAPQQLDCFGDREVRWLAAAASKLRRLEVLVKESRPGENVKPFQASDEQLRGLGRLLRAAPNLEVLDICCEGRSPWLIMDPTSSSMETADPPPLPLRSWRSPGELQGVLSRWVVRQQQQLSHTLRQVDLRHHKKRCASQEYDVDGLTVLTGLKQLQLNGGRLTIPAQLTSLSGLSSLQLPAGSQAAAVAAGLTGLQRLSLSAPQQYSGRWRFREVPRSFSALHQLKCLDISMSDMVLQPDLGVWLPQLERLRISGGLVTAVPEGLTCLTWLCLEYDRSKQQLTLPPDLSGLKELAVPRSRYTSLAGLGHLPGLELLDVSCTGALGSSLDVLRPLAALRHLNLKNITGCDPASFTALGALQQLTYLNMDGLLNCTAAVASLVPLPSVRELHIERYCTPAPYQEGRQPELHAFGPWLQQMTGVTKLAVRGHALSCEDKLLYLPGQLQWLGLNKMKIMYHLPEGLRRLSALRVLHIEGNDQLYQLPQWLWVLPRLEEIDLRRTAVTSEQSVLAYMPALRYVRTGSRKSVLRRAQHLHFGPGTSSPDVD